MYWQGGRNHVLLWIASLTLAMSAVAALSRAGSSGAALSFLTAGLVLAPPVQAFLAQQLHYLAPAKAALYSSITLVPIGLGFVAVDGVATLDREARKLGFSSAGRWARAKDLNLSSPQALAAHEEAERAKSMTAACRGLVPLPLACFEPGHQKAALAFIEARHRAGELEAVVRGALAQQRKTYLAADRSCMDLLDRIDEDALPAMMQDGGTLRALAAGGWARRFAAAELDQLAARVKPGAAIPGSSGSRPLDQKLAVLAPAIEKELDGLLQAWARKIVMEEPSWRSFLRGRTPIAPCTPLQDGGLQDGGRK